MDGMDIAHEALQATGHRIPGYQPMGQPALEATTAARTDAAIQAGIEAARHRLDASAESSVTVDESGAGGTPQRPVVQGVPQPLVRPGAQVAIGEDKAQQESSDPTRIASDVLPPRATTGEQTQAPVAFEPHTAPEGVEPSPPVSDTKTQVEEVTRSPGERTAHRSDYTRDVRQSQRYRTKGPGHTRFADQIDRAVESGRMLPETADLLLVNVCLAVL